MRYRTRLIYPETYEEASRNQHGPRYKQKGAPQVRVVTLTAEFDSAADLASLIYLASQLELPIRWDAKATPQTAYIEVVGVDALTQAGVV